MDSVMEGLLQFHLRKLQSPQLLQPSLLNLHLDNRRRPREQPELPSLTNLPRVRNSRLPLHLILLKLDLLFKCLKLAQSFHFLNQARYQKLMKLQKQEKHSCHSLIPLRRQIEEVVGFLMILKQLQVLDLSLSLPRHFLVLLRSKRLLLTVEELPGNRGNQTWTLQVHLPCLPTVIPWLMSMRRMMQGTSLWIKQALSKPRHLQLRRHRQSSHLSVVRLTHPFKLRKQLEIVFSVRNQP